MIVLQQVQSLHHTIASVGVEGAHVQSIQPAEHTAWPANAVKLRLDGSIVFPGLVNSHDHLDFNLFPRLGHGPYSSYMEWGRDIHHRDRQVIDAVLRVPKPLRTQWGLYKNLLCGVTTVVQHGERLETGEAPITVQDQCYSLHSVGLEKRWKYRLNRPFRKRWPFAIHIGEGTGACTNAEIDTLIRWNILRRKLVGIHGVAMESRQARHFDALVWCPDSNRFLLGATAPVDQLKTQTQILFGTDATVSAGWNIWQHLRTARDTGLLTDEELYHSVTLAPAHVWGLKGSGSLEEGSIADIVVAEHKPGVSGFDAFFGTDPRHIILVIHKGKVVLWDEQLRAQLPEPLQAGYSQVWVEGRCKNISGDVPGLVREIQSYYPGCSLPVSLNP